MKQEIQKAQQEQGLAKITNVQLLKEWSVGQVIRKCSRINTTLAAIDSGMPTLSRLRKDVGDDAIRAYIEMWITNIAEFVNVGKNMRDEQIFETAGMILSEYFMLTLADVNLVFKNAKFGRYGAIYDRLDGQVILGWFEKYFKDRCNDAQERSINEASRHKSSNTPSFDRINKINKLK